MSETFLANQQLFALAWVVVWAAILILVWHLRQRRRDRRWDFVHKERLMAMEKGIPAPEWPDFDERRPRGLWAEIRVNPRWPLGVGAVLALTGIGLCVALRLSLEPYHHRVWSMGLVPVFTGVGFFLHYALTRPGSPSPDGRG